MLKDFAFENVAFKKDSVEDCLVVTGDVANRSGRDYSSAVFRIVVFAKDTPLGHTNITINGFGNGRVRRFEKRMSKVTYSQVSNKISSFDFFFESGY